MRFASADYRARPRRLASSLWTFSLCATGFHLAALVSALADARAIAPLAQQPRVCPPSSDSARRVWPRVSVVVPARDEQRHIRRCVESLLAQDYPDYEVIVVDDVSTDATPSLLRRLRQSPAGRERLRVVRVETPPEGWAGKPYAMHIGAQLACGAWLLFTDADTCHAPAALRSAVARAEAERADLFTIITAQELPGFWSRALAPMVRMCTAISYPLRLVNNPRSRLALANGQFMLIRREFYDWLGGYAADELRGAIVDDVALARVVKLGGGRLLMVDGQALVATAMYRSLAEHWGGWSKNAVAAAPGGALFFACLAPWFPLLTVGPFALLAAGLLRRDRRMSAAGALPVVAALAYRAYADRGLAIPLRYGWTHPIGGAVFAAILARSLWYRLRGVTVPWRGRSYPAAAYADGTRGWKLSRHQAPSSHERAT